MSEVKRRVRCAVYTRKSTEEGLDMEFNSLDAQREAGEAYVLSQRHEGWTLVSDYYDDGGFSGGSMERPALKRLMRDVEAGAIDVIVVYKVDRLSRSLMDFAKLVEVFDRHNVSFVSVTQQFNTTTSMGRLTLNILLSFAQFEREVIGERIRDKLAASKRKGMWMGGTPPLGYDVVARKLVVNEAEAKQVRHIFERFITLRSATLLMKELRTSGIRTKTYVTQTGNQKTGRFFSKNQIYRTLHNRLYLGEMPHKDKSYPGQHEAIIALDLWNEAHAVMQISPRTRGRNAATKTPALLKGIVRCGGCASAMSPTHCLKKGKHYRYYKPSQLLKGGCETCPVGAIPAGELEEVVVNQLRQVFVHPEMIVRTWAAANAQDTHASHAELSILRLAIDTGYATQEVYDWVRKQSSDRVIAVKGMDRLGATIGTPSHMDVTAQGKRKRRGLLVWPVGASFCKSELYGCLRKDKPTDEQLAEGENHPAGFCHFPKYGEEYFKQLTAERLVTVKDKRGFPHREWRKLRERNEALDCRVYARAAASALGIDRFGEATWQKLERSLGRIAPPKTDTTETQKPTPTAPAARRVIRSDYL